ncbi:hypothetical protein [Oceanospirillum sediminis]|uniref:Uncharacterized protein n=1 Tax=Oceanospirillum sediminis TaxID=2760088 RepID=A0A839IVA6_9GAMM|nr:hypothetical protein [Oceanospirillum sediminis]MBB1488399.1 hypothetical protein [Oceanospirillum sediminis]
MDSDDLIMQIAPTLSADLQQPGNIQGRYFIKQYLPSDQAEQFIQAMTVPGSELSGADLSRLLKLEQDYLRQIQQIKNSPAEQPVPSSAQSKPYRPQLIISIVFFTAYFLVLAVIISIEASDSLNQQKGDNSFMDQIQILLGVLTAGIGQVLSYWFGIPWRKKEDQGQ